MIKKILCYLFLLCMFTMLSAGCSRFSVLPGTSQKGSADVDESSFAGIKGDYQAVETDEIGGWWHLYIGEDQENDLPYYFTIYDNGAGNPGVQGEIIKLNDTSLTLKVHMDMFEQMPADWTLEDDSTLTLEYVCDETSITLTNSDLPVVFER